MKKFFDKYSIWFTTFVGIGLLVYFVWQWSSTTVLQRVVGALYIGIILHEWEELLFGFVEMNKSNMNLGLDPDNPGFGQLILFIFTLYLGVVPLFFPQIIWLSVTALVLGMIELFAHIGAIRMNRSKHLYIPGLATAIVLPIISVYGFYYIINNHLMRPIWWLYAVLNLFIPLICAQFLAVKSMGGNYREFLKNAFFAMSKKK